MTFSRKKLDTQILKSVFSDTLISHILCLLEKIIASSSPTTVPPLNDITPFFYYVVPSTDTTRSLIHVSLACWNTENHLLAALLNALDPLYREYIARHPQPELDAYGSSPPLDVVRVIPSICIQSAVLLIIIKMTLISFTLFSFWRYYMILLITPFIRDTESVLKEFSREQLSGDSIYFDPQRRYAVLPPNTLTDTPLYPTLKGNYRIDCAYINLGPTSTESFLARQASPN